MTGKNDALVTVNWAQPPVSQPESQLIGSTYQDVEAIADARRALAPDAGKLVWLMVSVDEVAPVMGDQVLPPFVDCSH